MTGGISIGKEIEYNEDAIFIGDNLIAVSDGAGGGGLFADKWSQYLLENLPNSPINNFTQFDAWIDSIWDSFYTEREIEAETLGEFEKNKFYDEGSLATIAALWIIGDTVKWITYGDSCVFCYNRQTGELFSSISTLTDFNKAPYLINCNDSLDEIGFRSGEMNIWNNCIFFCTSDALAHYILASYMISKYPKYEDCLHEAIRVKSRNSNYVSSLLRLKKIDFEKDILIKLIQSCKNKANFNRHLAKILRNNYIALDDYSIVFFNK